MASSDGNGLGTQRPVITRFAPSPTGFLHIGNARTGLFSWLYARHLGGKALLRIEDTDKKRSTQEAIDVILDGLDWLGLEFDGETVFQSERADRHAEVAQKLLDAGKAYKCFATTEELSEMREQQRAAKQPIRYDGRWRDRDPVEAPEGAEFTIRIKTPEGGETIIEDAVQGRVKVDNREIDDFILLRADGTPTYMLAVVVDDMDMGCTHIIRGDDHLNNAFRQMQVIEAMQGVEDGWERPVYAHVPLIHGNDGAKLSKRHGALSTLAYRDMGYLPEAMKAYLLRLGWSHGDQEIFTEDEAIALFDIGGINKAPARLDLEKLGQINAHFIRLADDERLFSLLKPLLEAEAPLTEAETARIRAALPGMKDRGTTLPELAAAFAFLRDIRPIQMNKKARKSLSEEGLDRLVGLRDELQQLRQWTAETISHVISSYCADRDLSMGQVGQPLRAALTGGLPAPDIAPVLEWLGKDETLGRIEDQTALDRD